MLAKYTLKVRLISLKGDTILLTDVYLFVLSVQHDFQPVSQIL